MSAVDGSVQAWPRIPFSVTVYGKGDGRLQRLDLQFHAFFVIVLSGVVLAFLFDLLRVMRGHYRPPWWLAAGADALFWVVATLALSGGLFLGNWGELRFYVLVGLLIGIGLYYWLASPVVTASARLLIRTAEWLVELIGTLLVRLIWRPVVALAVLLWGAALLLWQWTSGLVGGIWRALLFLGAFALRPLNGPYRCLKLHYLLTRRRIKRTLRRWLLGPPDPRRR